MVVLWKGIDRSGAHDRTVIAVVSVDRVLVQILTESESRLRGNLSLMWVNITCIDSMSRKKQYSIGKVLSVFKKACQSGSPTSRRT